MPYNAIYLREGLRALLDVVDDHIDKSPAEGLGLIQYGYFQKAIGLEGGHHLMLAGIQEIGEKALSQHDDIANAFYAEMEKPVDTFYMKAIADMWKPVDTKPVLRSIATTSQPSISPVKADEITETSNLPSHYELPPNPITGIGQIADIARQLSQLCTDMERETNKGCL